MYVYLYVNPFATGYTQVYGWTFESIDNINICEVIMSLIIKIFKHKWNDSFFT